MDLNEALNDQDSSEFLFMFVILRAYRCACAILDKEISLDIFKYHYVHVHVHLHRGSCPDDCIVHTDNYSRAIELTTTALTKVQAIFICQGLNELEENKRPSPNQMEP